MKTNLSNFIPAVLAILGLSEFNKGKDGKAGLSDEECAKLKKYDFSDSFIADFKAYIANPPATDSKSEDGENIQMAAVSAMLGKMTANYEKACEELEALKASTATEKTAHAAAVKAKEQEISSLQGKIKTLSELPEHDPGKAAGISGDQTASFDIYNTEQLGGQPGEYFSLDRPYNLRAQAALLAAEGKSVIVAGAKSADYTRLQEDLGAFYRRPWMEQIQSFLVKLPTIFNLFPMEAGHQHLDTLVNIFLGEFSQADSSGKSDFDKVAKGTFEFGTETLLMYDVMFVHKFKDMKQIEKLWIGYLNREHSNPVKLSFIEYLMVEVSKALYNEQQLRLVNGVRKDPDVNKPGKAMEAADGIYEYLRKRIDGHIDLTPNGGLTGKRVYQIKPFALPRITPGNIGEVFYQGTSMIPAQFRDTGNIILYIPSWMLPLYNKYNEAKYGRNTDYAGDVDYVREFPSVKIKTIPNADNHCRIFWTFDGNIKSYCDKRNEMFDFTFEQHNWEVDVWSNWKESIQAVAVGYKYLNKLDVDGSRQLIWANDYDMPDSYFYESPKDENPSVLIHSSIVTSANSKEFAITDIADAKVGEIITLKCGADGENGVVIENKDKFSLLAESWKPRKGDIIVLMMRADLKFIEISRSIAAAEFLQFAPDETTPSLEGATSFVTGENTKATAITDLTDALEGVVYTIHGNGKTNATTIASGNKFVLSKAMTLSAGTFISLVKGADGKFYEVNRG